MIKDIKAIISASLLSLSIVFLIWASETSKKTAKTIKKIENSKKELSEMLGLAQIIEQRKKSGQFQQQVPLISLVERKASENNIKFESVKPSQEDSKEICELTIRGETPKNILNFLISVQSQDENLTISELKIRRNFSDRDFVDSEIKIERIR